MNTMHTWTLSILLLTAVAMTCCITTAAPTPTASAYASPTAIVSDGTNLYIACATSPKVLMLNAKTKKFVGTIKTALPSTGIALANGTLYTTQGIAPGKVVSICAKSHKATDLKTAIDLHAPCAPLVAGKSVYLADRYRNLIVNATNGKTISVSREPIAMAATPDGKTLIVANLLPADKADGHYASSLVSFIDTATDKLITELPLANGATGLRGIAIDPAGKFAYVTHILARYQLPTTQIERGWINTNALSILDIATRKVVNTVLLDDVDLGAANPWAVAVSPDNKNIVVTHAGTHELSIIDTKAMHARLAEYTKDKRADEVPNKLSFLAGIRRRLQMPGRGPRSIVILGRIAWIPMYFTDTLVRVDLDDTTPRAVTSLPLGPKPTIDSARQGEIFFHDAILCLQKWQSCSSCHPDARTDALNWDLLNDGLGSPKQTKSMLYSHYTPPVMVTGIRPTAEIAVRAGIRHIQFAVRPDSDAQAVDAYLKNLNAVPSPYLVNGKLSPSAKRGEKLFTTAECNKCHTGKYYTDLKQYDMGLGVDIEKGRKFDTPTLLECWRSGPYLYDGRAKSMMDVLTNCNKKDTHGKTSKLTKTQLADLCEYILSL